MTDTTTAGLLAAARERITGMRLRVDFIDAKPQTFDWTENTTYEDGDPRWEVFEATTCDECDQAIVDSEDHGVVDSHGASVRLPDDVPFEDLDEWAEAQSLTRCSRQGEDALDLGAEGPMMNYRYPIAEGTATKDNARELVHVALCLVAFEDEEFLALTGGGMDMSWEICLAYITLGFYPPTHFGLPAMADKYLDHPTTALVLAGSQIANEIQAQWAARRAEDLSRMAESLRTRGNED